MLGVSLSRGANALIAVVIALTPVVVAAVPLVYIDPGHGGTDPGNQGGYCDEKNANMNVGYHAADFLSNDEDYEFTITRWGDYTVDLNLRVLWANSDGADAYVAMHHNSVGVQRALTMYCVAQNQSQIWTLSRDLAQSVNGNVYAQFGSHDGLWDRGVCEDDNDSQCGIQDGQHFFLRLLTMPACVGEPAPMNSASVWGVCNDTGYTINQGFGYYHGICEWFGTCSIAVGMSFVAVGGACEVALYWDDEDAGTSYTLLRGDSCWGPWAQIATIPWNSSGHYTYTDQNVDTREYSYKLVVSPSGEIVEARATPSCGGAINPGAPTNLDATVDYSGGPTADILLSWTAAPNGYGFVNYNVYRAVHPMITCDSAHEMVGTTGDLTFTDADVPVGPTYHYRVMADDSEGQSLSDEITASITYVGAPEDVAGSTAGFDVVADVGRNGTVVLTITADPPEVVSVEIYDVAGRRISVPLRDATVAGRRTCVWNGSNRAGRTAGAGIYFVRAVTSRGTEKRVKVALVR